MSKLRASATVAIGCRDRLVLFVASISGFTYHTRRQRPSPHHQQSEDLLLGHSKSVYSDMT